MEDLYDLHEFAKSLATARILGPIAELPLNEARRAGRRGFYSTGNSPDGGGGKGRQLGHSA